VSDCKLCKCDTAEQMILCEIVNKGINNLNGVYSGITHHNTFCYDLFKLCLALVTIKTNVSRVTSITFIHN
jgi:hypothetical protein